MLFETIVEGGIIVDGTGAPERPGDVGVVNGRIAAIGDLSAAESAERIDARGRFVTPGFIDMHTHLDAQAAWDPLLQSSCFHGVTTVLIGNCGMSFAPVRAGEERALASMMEAVEDIDADVILAGMPWTWRSYGEFLDVLDELTPALNIVGLVGHSAVRFHVMGDRSLDEDARATDEERRQIADLVAAAVRDGAAGFSTSRFVGHRVPDGRNTPGTWADEAEIGAIAAALRSDDAGRVFQMAPDFGGRFSEELALMESVAAQGANVLFTGGATNGRDGSVHRFESFMARVRDGGGAINCVAHARPSGTLYGVQSTAPFDVPAWRALMSLPTLQQRLDVLGDTTARRTLSADAKSVGFQVDPALIHPLGRAPVPHFDLDDEASLAQIARDAGMDPVDVFIDGIVHSEGRQLSNVWLFGGNIAHQWRFLQVEGCIPAFGDAGAHVARIADADSPTFLLSEHVNQRRLFSWPEAVHRLTSLPASILGLADRGELREGHWADLNVIDAASLACGHPEFVRDLPLGRGRMACRSMGFDVTMIAGQPVIRGGVPTGRRPGRVLREFRHRS